MRIAVFASGNGSNVEAIIQASLEGRLDAEIACLFCDNPHAYVIERAIEHNIPFFVCAPQQCETREKWEGFILSFLETHQVDWIVLAGFMRIIGQPLLNRFPNRILNIHPSLLPAFPGKNSIKEAFDAKATHTGVTVHYVDNGIDTGPVIAQEEVAIQDGWDLETLEEAIHQIEHRLYPEIIQQVTKKECAYS